MIELLSDTGLGKETHSVISQGRVEAIVTSKPRDRRLLIEEAAGLGKHRKRRRRAQLKLERTQENLDRALDIEREARTRLRPLKRQAEAAELHERLERQILQVRLELALDGARARRLELEGAEAAVGAARRKRERIEALLEEVIDRRGAAERALAERAERHDALSRARYEMRSTGERLALRAEQVQLARESLSRRAERIALELQALGAEPEAAGGEGREAERLAALEGELAEVRAAREEEIERETAGLVADRERQGAEIEAAAAAVAAAEGERERAAGECEAARAQLAQAERGAEDARRNAASVGAELAAANQFLRAHARFDGGRALGEELRVREGYELALAAALGGRLEAAVVADVAGAEAVLDGAGPDGGAALLVGGRAGGRAGGAPPAPGAVALLELLSGPDDLLELAGRLLGDAWVVERLEDLEDGFVGIAVTRRGRVLFGGAGEVRQLGEGGSELVLARRNERDRLIASSETAAQAELEAKRACELAVEELRAREGLRTGLEEALREAQRRRLEVEEAGRRTEWLIEQRRAAPAGPLAVRQAELEGALAAERRELERQEEERARRRMRLERLRGQQAADAAVVAPGERLQAALAAAAEAVQMRLDALEEALAGDRLAGDEMAGELRACAARESEIQAELRLAGEGVTAAEVAAQRVRDQAGEAEVELAGLVERLGVELPGEDGAGAGEATGKALEDEELLVLRGRVERLERRREQLGPVNPLAQDEYAGAVAHVEELEAQRGDLEAALRELRGVIRETDRQIQETFEQTFAAAARNFEELVGDVFPGGSGRLKLVAEEQPQRAVLGGNSLGEGGEQSEDTGEAAAEAEAEAEAGGRGGA